MMRCSRQLILFASLCASLFFAAIFPVGAQENEAGPARFLGVNSCSSSGCHGGGAAQRNECIIWAGRDVHTRAYATLTTARSARMAEVLKMDSPVTNAACTVCHAPFQTVPVLRQKNPLDITKGISCESCHGPAENWLLSHTRRDFSHADRVHAGMRDVKNLYARANSCVACHQNVPAQILAAGHPELIFELDGQAVSEPKHWRESTNWSGAQTWLVGQAVALREMSWELSKNPNDQKLQEKFSGLLWLLEKLPDEIKLEGNSSATNIDSARAKEIQKQSDELAQKISAMNWSPELTQKTLLSLAGTSEDFRKNDLAQSLQSRRAERLVIGLDRLVAASSARRKAAVDSSLNKLYAFMQSLPDFARKDFAEALEKFSQNASFNP